MLLVGIEVATRQLALMAASYCDSLQRNHDLVKKKLENLSF